MATRTAPEADMPLLRVDGLSVRFFTDRTWQQVTHEVTFALAQGKTLALVGESGSGKSVTAMALTGLLPGNGRVTGSATFDGTQVVGGSADQLRRLCGAEVGTIFQEPMTALNPVYTVGHQIARAVTSHSRLSSDRVRRRTLELLELVRMPDASRRVRHYPHQLSGGQRQRVMIAMALASQPRLLVADEPTTALDVTVQAEILELLADLRNRLGMALLLITHDMGVVADAADDVVVMRAGAVVETGEVFDLFAEPACAYTRQLLDTVPYLGRPQRLHAEPAAADANPDLPIPPGRAVTAAIEDTPIVTVRDLTVTYHGRRRRDEFTAVQDVSFELRDGETLGLVGESGSGKSTIGRAILGLTPITQGDVLLGEASVRGASRKALRRLRRAVGIVFQDPASSLNPRVPIGRSVVEPLYLHGIERSSRALRLRSAELLDAVGLPTSWSRRYPHELSGGQRQRVGIARAVSLRPKVLVADEPTSALDVSVQATVLALLKDLQREVGFCCLFISHDLAVVEILADRVIALQEGSIVEAGTTAEVLRGPTEPYTRRLLAAAPVPDPVAQRARRAGSPPRATR